MRQLVVLLVLGLARLWALDLGPLPPTTTWVVAVEVQRSLASPLGPMVRKWAAMPDNRRRIEAIATMSGIDPLKDIDQFIAGGHDFTPESGFVVLRGRFDGDRLARLAGLADGHQTFTAGTITVHRWLDRQRDGQETFAALTGDRLVFTSHRPTIDLVLHAMATPGDPSPTVAALAGISAPVVLAGSASNLAALAQLNRSASLLHPARSLLITVAPDDTAVQIDATVTMADATAAGQAQQMVQGLVTVVANDRETSPATRAMVATSRIACRGSDLHLGMAVTLQHLSDSIAGALSRHDAQP